MEPSHSQLNRHYKLILIGILLVSFGLRVYQLGYQSLRGDEGATYIYSARPLGQLFEIVRFSDPHPPLYYTLMHGWIAVGGDTEFALRFFSVITGILLIASMAALGKMIIGPRLGLIVALLVGLNPYHIFYAQDARSYPLATLLGVWATIALWQALRGNAWRHWIAYGICVLALMHTHYYAVFIVVFQGVFVIWDWWRRRRFPLRYVVVGVIDVLLFLPWLILSWGVITDYEGAVETVGIGASLWRPLVAFAGTQLLEPPFTEVNVIVAMVLLCLGAINLLRKHRPAALLLMFYLAVPLIGVYVASRARPIFNERYLILASPAFFLLIGAGLTSVFDFRRLRGPVLSLLFAMTLFVTWGTALSNHYFNPQFAKSPPWREILGYIVGKARPGDALIYTAPLPPILYYNQDHLPVYLIPYEPNTSLPEAVDQLEQILEDYNRVWLVPAAPDNWWVAHQIEPWLDRHSNRVDQTFFRVVHIGLYESRVTFFNTMTPQLTKFEGGIQLDGFRVSDGKSAVGVEPGESLPLTLIWHTEQQPATAYTVFTHLVGPDGMVWGQWDNPPVWGTYPTSEWGTGETVFDQYLIPVKEDAPSGMYHLLVGLYDPATGVRLPVLNQQSEPSNDHIQLAVDIAVD